MLYATFVSALALLQQLGNTHALKVIDLRSVEGPWTGRAPTPPDPFWKMGIYSPTRLNEQTSGYELEIIARALCDGGDPVGAGPIYKLAAQHLPETARMSGGLLLEESAVSLGNYADVIAIDRIFQSRFDDGYATRLWLVVALCELRSLDVAFQVFEKEFPLNHPIRSESFGLPVSRSLSRQSLEATAWYLLFKYQGGLHSERVQLKWLTKANALSPGNPAICQEIGQLLEHLDLR